MELEELMEKLMSFRAAIDIHVALTLKCHDSDRTVAMGFLHSPAPLYNGLHWYAADLVLNLKLRGEVSI